ncbi:hypothetical protein D3C79_751620 [compost metagenome]
MHARHLVVPAGVDELRFDLEHVFREVAAQLDEVAAVVPGGRVTHHIGRCDRGAAAQHAGLLHLLPGLRLCLGAGQQGNRCREASDAATGVAGKETSHFESLR